METPARFTFSPDGSTTVFQIPVTMKGDNYVRIDVDNITINDRDKFDIVNNSIVFVSAADVPANSTLSVLVVQTDEGISNLGNVNSIDIVSQNIAAVSTTATNISAITTVVNNLTAVQNASANATAAANSASAASISEAEAMQSEINAAGHEAVAGAYKDQATAQATAAATSAASALAAQNAAESAEAGAILAQIAAEAFEDNALAYAVALG